MANNALSIRLPEHLQLSDIDEKAKKLGLSRAAFSVKALEMLLGFDEGFLKDTQEKSLRLNIPEHLVIQNTVIKKLAKDAAEIKVWGPGERLMEEFMYSEEGPITGEQLFNILKKMYINDLEREKIEQLLAEEAAGAPLSEEDGDFLFKHRRGQKWYESNEYKEIVKFREEYEKLKAERPERAKRPNRP